MRKYVIMGIQGSGKGTQAKMLAADLDLVHISVGDIFRWNVQNHTKMGAQVRRTMAAGELVGDDLVESVVRDRLTQHDWNFGFIIDGFPRDPRQAEFFLESYDIDGVIELDLPDSEVRRRVLNRRLCGDCGMDYNLIANSPKVPGRCDMCGGELITREDDTEEALAVRLRDYHDQTNPVLEIFRRKEYVYTVDARPAPEVIQQQIRECLGLPPYQPETGEPKLREISVFGGTVHSALAAEVRADLGVRCPAKPGQQRHCLAVPHGPGAEQCEPLHDESRINSARGRGDVKDQPAAQGRCASYWDGNRSPLTCGEVFLPEGDWYQEGPGLRFTASYLCPAWVA